MLDKLAEVLASMWEAALPVAFVKAWEGGVLLRAGRFQRVVGPGPVWKIPFVDEVFATHTCVTTERVDTQCLTTKDGKTVAITAVVKYSVRDVKPYLLEVFDRTDALSDVVSGAVGKVASSKTLAELLNSEPEKEVLEATRRRANQWGLKIDYVTFVDLCAVRPIRLMHTGVNQQRG
jgi:regulator of protease activity HflC (stomatin/prohibitin superfamily)